jgi:hypothetical protein
MQVNHIDENKITWMQFKNYFQNKYLSNHYYDRKMKDFFEINLWSLTMDEYERIFSEILRYVDFIKEEKVNIKRLFSGIPSIYSDNI